jgi:putative ABC transport system permease protein
VTRFVAYALEALGALWRNRTRSVLTMLGMIIGTSSVIAVFGIGSMASSGISGSLNSFGDPGLFILVDRKQDDPAAASIQFRDAATVAAENSGILAHVYPLYDRNYTIKANGTTSTAEVTSTSDYIVDTLTLREGRRIGPNEVAGAEHVTLLSQPLERKFFGNALALGQTIRISGVRFTIIGVYDELKASIFSSAGGADYMEIPYTTYHEIAPGPIDILDVYPSPGVKPDEVQTAVFNTLRHVHGPRAQYQVQDSVAFLNGFQAVIGVVSLGVTAIGGVALLVAGIGIMNIMLVSVTERTREIGIRKAIGGSRGDIVTQFLFEAVILSILGGGVGTFLGISFVLLAGGVVSKLLGPAPVPFLEIILIATGFSTLVGVTFGTYPAMRAGRLDPIEALRS